MSITRVALGLAAAVLASSGPARAEEPPTDVAARRAAVAKLGRIVWSDLGRPVALADLDGGNVVETTVEHATSLKWLRDGRRVLATTNGRVLTIDSATGVATDLAPDAPKDVFVAPYPLLSPDGRHAVYWHSPRRDHLPLEPFAYAVFDLESGGYTDVGTLAFDSVREPGHSERPFAWWSPDGRLYACVAGDLQRDEKRGTRWKLIRWSPAEKTTETVATPPWGTRVTQTAFLGDRVAYVIDAEQQYQYVPRVVSGTGDLIFELRGYGLIWGVRWEADGSALRLRIQAPDASHTTKFWRVVPGEKMKVEIPEFDPPRHVPTSDPAIGVEARSKQDDPLASGIFRVATATGEATRIGPGSWPLRIADVVVFWRVTIPSKLAEGPYFEHPKTIHGSDDLWAYDPKDGAVIRLSDRGFTARCWDIRANAAEPAKR